MRSGGQGIISSIGVAIAYDYVKFAGGLDEITPPLADNPGALTESENFEVVPVKQGGYRRIGGYERFDGRPSPSDATFSLVQVSGFTNTPTVGQTLTGMTSSATGIIVAVGSNYMALTKIVGTFTSSEAVQVGATPIGTATPTTTILSAVLTAQYTQAAADNYRADIGAVPGSGPVRGVVSATFGGVDYVYAFRDNAGGTATILYKSSGTGWTLVGYYYEVSFTAGGAGTPADGNTLTQGGVTATIKRVVQQSGSWSGSTSAGRFIITAPSGGNFAAGAATAGAVGVTLSGVQTVITMAVGGTFEFDVANFSGQSSTARIYGCDGVNRGFEFDGDTLVPIVTGTSPDAPSHVKENQKHLMWAIRSSVVHSAPGFPYKYLAVDGGSEIACGDTITNLLNQPGSVSGGAFGITSITNTYILYGTTSADWKLVPFNTGVGGLPFTARLLHQSYWLDDPGVVNMNTSQNYGNFGQSTITNNIPNFIEAQRAKSAYAVVNRARNQYCLYWSDGVGLEITIVNGKVYGMGKLLFPNPMFCAWSATTSLYVERIWAGSASGGYVYEMDKGSSFDGADLNAYIKPNFNFQGSPRTIKRYRRASFEISGNFYANFAFTYTLGYNSDQLIQPVTRSYDTGFSGVPLWDSFVWDAFTWDGATLSPTEVPLRGSGVNIQPLIRCGTNYIQPFTISSMIIHYSKRRGLK